MAKNKHPGVIDLTSDVKIICLGNGSYVLSIKGAGVLRVNAKELANVIAEHASDDLVRFFGKDVVSATEDVLDFFGFDVDLDGDGE